MILNNKTFIVTGGGNGMGRAIVLQLLERGAHVVAADINAQALDETAALSGSNSPHLTTSVINITDRSAVSAWAQSLCTSVSSIDGIINNAGIIQPFTTIETTDYDVARRLFDVNFWGMFNVTQAFLPHLFTRPEACIINISSMGGFLPVPGQAVYGASKAAVKLFTESLASELADTCINVTTVLPGALNTDIKKHSGIAAANMPTDADDTLAGRALSPQKAAAVVVNAMEQGDETVCVGNDALSMYRLCRTNPQKAAQQVRAMMKHHL